MRAFRRLSSVNRSWSFCIRIGTRWPSFSTNARHHRSIADMALTNYSTGSSSAMARIDYDAETEECFITFQDGRSYTLVGIPQIEVERWANSGSLGGYWNANLRGRY